MRLFTIIEALAAAYRRLRGTVTCHVALLPVCLALLTASESSAQVSLATTTREINLRPFVEVLEDTNGQLTVDDLERAEFSRQFQRLPGDNDLNFGFTPRVYWLRVGLHPEPDAASRWLIEVAYPSLDRVSLFIPREGRFQRTETGDRQAFSERPFSHHNLVVPIDLVPGSETTIYLRVESTSSLTLPIAIWSPTALHANDQVFYSGLALYFGMLLALGLYNFLLYCSLREPAYLAYVAFTVSIAIGQLSFFGLGNQFLWPNSPVWGNVATPVGYCLAAFFGALFTQTFLGTRRATPVVTASFSCCKRGSC